MDEEFIRHWENVLRPLDNSNPRISPLDNPVKLNPAYPNFFTGNFQLQETADTYFDLGNYSKGVVFINGHNLGRFWNIGPQKRLYCPASWLKKGRNELVVFDLHGGRESMVAGFTSME